MLGAYILTIDIQNLILITDFYYHKFSHKDHYILDDIFHARSLLHFNIHAKGLQMLIIDVPQRTIYPICYLTKLSIESVSNGENMTLLHSMTLLWFQLSLFKCLLIISHWLCKITHCIFQGCIRICSLWEIMTSGAWFHTRL